MRKIIQLIVSAADKDLDPEAKYNVLFALCDDGTVWWQNIGEGMCWQQFSCVPGTEEKVF